MNIFRCGSNSNKIDIHQDDITSAIEKKLDNKSLSSKTLDKLISISNSRYTFKSDEARFIFRCEGSIHKIDTTSVLKLLVAIRGITPKSDTDFMATQLQTWENNALKLLSMNAHFEKARGELDAVANSKPHTESQLATQPGDAESDDEVSGLLDIAMQNQRSLLVEERFDEDNMPASIDDIPVKNITAEKFAQIMARRDYIYNKLNRLSIKGLVYDVALTKKEKEKRNEFSFEMITLNKLVKGYELAREVHSIGFDFKADNYPPHRGNFSKISSLALLDARFSELMGKNKLPLLAEKSAPVSLRKIAKLFGSLQGEILQANDLKKLAEFIGYKVDIVSPQTAEDFSNCIKNNVADKGVIVFYSADVHSLYGINEEDGFQFTENSSVVSRYDAERNVCTLNHWGEKFPGTPVDMLFNSSRSLDKTLHQEAYDVGKTKGRHLHTDPVITPEGMPQYKYPNTDKTWALGHNIKFKQSIHPANNSGFKGLVMMIEPNKDHQRWQAADTLSFMDSAYNAMRNEQLLPH